MSERRIEADGTKGSAVAERRIDEVREASRVALVTGGSRGIGRACAVALAGAGHRVALCYRADKEGAAETAAAITEAGGEALPIAADVADPAALDSALKEIESTWGPVQILVNNAGVTRDGLLMRMSDEQWGEVLHTNLDGPFYAIRRATPGMIRGRFGRIVNIGSATGFTGSAGQVNYATAKAGLLGLTRSVARELASRNVTCNLVSPGPISTTMLEAASEERVAELRALVPLGRLGTPDEVGATVAFLCSEAAGYITGAVIPVDGGISMGL